MTDRMNITLVNDFHGTEAVVRPREIEKYWERGHHVFHAIHGLTHSQVLRARRKLCGIAECTCGGIAGERGGQWWVDVWHESHWLRAENTYTIETTEELAP
jgi:hypothetical protein